MRYKRIVSLLIVLSFLYNTVLSATPGLAQEWTLRAPIAGPIVMKGLEKELNEKIVTLTLEAPLNAWALAWALNNEVFKGWRLSAKAVTNSEIKIISPESRTVVNINNRQELSNAVSDALKSAKPSPWAILSRVFFWTWLTAQMEPGIPILQYNVNKRLIKDSQEEPSSAKAVECVMEQVITDK
ncbi:hypothetical protein EOM82_07030, partial [bacterium]|nr:hypothetical protein [bacterium]